MLIYVDLSVFSITLRGNIPILHCKIKIKQINIAMKKLLILFAVLLTSVGAWAQVITEVGDAFDPTGLIVLNSNHTGYGDHYVMEVVKFKGSDSNTQTNTYLYTEDSSSRIKVGSLPLNDADNYRYIFNIYKMGDSKYKIWVNNQGLPSFANNAGGGFNIETTTAAAEQTLIKVQEQENVYMIRGFADDRAYLMLDDENSQKVVKVTGSADNAMWVKIHKVTVKSSEIVFDTEKKYYLVESSSNFFVGKGANNKAKLYSDFSTANPFKVSIDVETGCHTFQTDDSYLYAGWWDAETSSSKCVWSVEDIDAEGYFTLHFTGDANNSARQTGFLGTTSATNGQQLYSNQTHYQGKIMRFRLVEEDQVQNVTYKFKDDSGKLLATKTLTVIGTYPDASLFLKVPSDAVTMQGAPTGNVNPNKSEYEITVSYNSNFPFVPTTIVDGNFAQGTKWYNMKIRNKNNRMKYVEEQSGETVTKTVKSRAGYNNQDDEAQYFAFVGNVFDGFYIYNRSVGAGKAMKCTTGGTTFEENDGTCVELFHGNSNGYWQFAPLGRTQTNGRIHDFQPDLKLWDAGGASGDPGSNITIFEVDIDGGKVVANFQFKLDGEVKYTERKEYYAGYDITLTPPPYGISHNIEKMPKEGGDIEVPWTYTGTFNYFPSYNEITKWYYLKFDAANNYFLYHQDGADHIALDRQELKIDDLESHSWAFVGNPFDGYKIYNKATGKNKILSSSTTMSGSQGGGTYPVLTSTPVPNGNNELWYATPSGHATNGFFLEQKGYASNRLNNREYKKDNASPTEYRLAYWTGGAGSGSTFVVENAIPVRLTTDENNPICYALKTGRTFDSKEWWYNYDSTDGKISLTQFDGSDAQWWYFKGILVDNKVCVQLVPKSDNKKFMSYEGSGNGAEKIIAKPDKTTGYTNTWRFAFKGGRYVLQTSDGSNYLSQNGGEGKKMGLYSGSSDTDGGTALYIYETMPVALSDNAGNVHTGYGLYELESLAALKMNGAYAFALSNIQRGETFTADVDFGFPVSKHDGTADFSVLISGWRGTKAEGYFKYYVDGSNVKVTSVSPTSANVRNFEWSIYPHLEGSDFTFTIKNIGTGKYIQTNAEVEATAAGTVTVGDEAHATSFIWEANNRFKIVDQNLRLSVSSSSTEDQDLGVDEGHGGCNTFITNTIDCVNNWKTQNIALLGYVGAYPSSMRDDINGVVNYSDIPTFEQVHAEDVISLTEGYYYIKGTGVGGGMSNYVNLKDQNSKKALWTETQNEADLSADNIFRFVAAGDNKYKIQSYSNGKYLQLKVAANNADNNSYLDYSYNDGYAFAFTDMGIAKHQIVDGNGGVMRTEGGNAQINSWSGETTETWYLIQAPELPLTIHSTGYSTFSAAVDVEVPEGVTAYYAKEQIGDSHIRMYPITTIPANEGVVLKGASSAEVKFPIIADAAELPAENLLKAHLNTEAVEPSDNSVFVMATRDGATGFYPLSTTNNIIGGHKSYLEIPTPANPGARLSIVWDDIETGVFETEGGVQNAEIYDLTGRRLDKPAKGVNVIGGKLVIK